MSNTLLPVEKKYFIEKLKIEHHIKSHFFWCLTVIQQTKQKKKTRILFISLFFIHRGYISDFSFILTNISTGTTLKSLYPHVQLSFNRFFKKHFFLGIWIHHNIFDTTNWAVCSSGEYLKVFFKKDDKYHHTMLILFILLHKRLHKCSTFT